VCRIVMLSVMSLGMYETDCRCYVATLIFIDFVGCHHVKGRIRKLYTHIHIECDVLTHRLVAHDQN